MTTKKITTTVVLNVIGSVKQSWIQLVTLMAFRLAGVMPLAAGRNAAEFDALHKGGILAAPHLGNMLARLQLSLDIHWTLDLIWMSREVAFELIISP